MIGAIPNPTKSISLNHPVEVVRDVVKNLEVNCRAAGCIGFRKKSEDDIMSLYTYQKGEFLSLGANINIQVEGDAESSKVNIEIARVMGAFDNWVEVSQANTHMTEILKGISWGLNPDPNKKVIFQPQTQEDKDAVQTGSIILYLILGIMFLFFILR